MPRGGFVGFVEHLDSATSNELLRAQQHRHSVLHENEMRVKTEVQRDRKAMQSKSTKSTYSRYLRHWAAWCDRKGYPDHNVKQDRFLVYMRENLAPVTDIENGVIPLRVVKSRKNEGTPDGEDEPVGTLPSFETVDGYVKAATDLYWSQKSDPENDAMHNEPSPRSAAIHTLMHSYRLRLAETKTSMDPSNLVIEQGHELGALKQLMRDGLIHNYPNLGGTKRHACVGLRNRLNASWSHYMMSRSENMRMATFPDIFSHVFHPEKDTDQMVLGVVLLMLRGKTNREGKANYGVVVRNKDVDLCPVGSLAFYLMEMWQVRSRSLQMKSVYIAHLETLYLECVARRR
ncbi:hypothetical protein B0O80DRAFT_517285 [Mortierella sp. GBAus27b]|nr:hypothetical protein B0O80DRAFT_517285 [Mortierella sp. GBAus27b]